MIDDTLVALTPAELEELKSRIVGAICDQPAHDTQEFDALMAYELSVINWDIQENLLGNFHHFDEWWTFTLEDFADMTQEPPF